MSVHLQRELDLLRKKVLTLGALVEENYRKAIGILGSPNLIEAEHIRQSDDLIDRMETEVEEECLKILALHQPVAADLRYIVSVLKLTNDLERIGDIAASLAKKSVSFKTDCIVQVINELTAMAHSTQAMLAKAMDALINMDTEEAKTVRDLDDEVDGMKKEIRIKMENAIQHDPANCKAYLAAMGAARNIERIADLSTNICEDVIYSASGRIVRHTISD